MLHRYFILHPRNIFLVDGLGALLSALLLILVANFETAFGLPGSAAYRLLPLPLILAAWSLGVYLVDPAEKKKFLLPVIIANVFYCCLTLALIIGFFSRLTSIGIAYLIIEIAVILFLTGIELRLYSRFSAAGHNH